MSESSSPSPKLQIRALTRGPAFHWFGYYDKHAFDPTGQYVLAHQTEFENRSPGADDVFRVGMIDTHDGDRWIELGQTRALNWQQGAMLQWVPGTASTVMWNDLEDGRFVCRLLDVKSWQARTLPRAVYTISPDGWWAISPDFARLNDCRPGYGYAGLPDAYADVGTPRETGIWKTDLRTGESTMLFSLADIAAVPGHPEYPTGAKHWFNHLLFSPDGSRFIFLHRWRGAAEPKNHFNTRMFTCNSDGSNPYVLDPHGKTSHFYWRDPKTVVAWSWHPCDLSKFYLYHDQSDKVEVIGRDVMAVNGHVTYLPDRDWILNDTYPREGRMQELYLYHVPTGRRHELGKFFAPEGYDSEWRADLHPRSSRDGRLITFDSAHAGTGRQVYLADIGAILDSE